MKTTLTIVRGLVPGSTTDRLQRPAPLLADRNGSLFVGLIVAMSILAVAGAAMLSLTVTSTFTELSANRHHAAYYIAESGGRYAIPQIQDDLGQAIGDLHGKTFTLTDGRRFTLLINNTSPDFVLLTSKGEVSKGEWAEASATIIYRFSKSYSGSFNRAVFGANKVHLKDSYIDSYDTTWTGEGDGYDENNPLILVGTNGGDSDIKVHKDATIYGLAASNEGRSLTPETPPAVFDNLVINGNNYSSGDNPVFSGGSQTISSGTYQLAGLKLTSQHTLNISGDVTLYVSGKTELRSESSIVLNSGATLTLFIGEELKVKEGSSVNGGGSPESLLAYGTDTAKKIDVNKSSSLTGLIYAPTAKIRIKGGKFDCHDDDCHDDDCDDGDDDDGSGGSYNGPSHAFGSLFGKNVKIYKNGAIHYDERLINLNLPGSTLTLGPPVQYFPD